MTLLFLVDMKDAGERKKKEKNPPLRTRTVQYRDLAGEGKEERTR